MSLKSHKNLVIVVGIAVALLVGTVLLASYSKNESTVKPQTNATTATVSCPMAKADFDASKCPAERTEACCAVEGQASECGKPCPPDCDKPCCAKDAAAGCPMQAEASGCCPVETDAAAQ